MKCLNDYLEKRYADLVEYAKHYTAYPTDLVHYSYLRIAESTFTFVNEQMTDAYFKRTIKTQSIRGFREDYEKEGIQFDIIENIPEEHDIDKRICIEKLDTIIRRLDEFDRTIFELYLRGENMTKLSYESDVPLRTIYHTLNRVRKIIIANT